MSAMSDFLEQALLNHVLRNTAFTTPGLVIYIALYTSTATLAELEASTHTNEVANAGSYARVQHTAWDAPTAAGATQNSSAITFAQATANWGIVRFVAITNNATYAAGNTLFFGQLTADKTINSGDQLVINTGDLDVTLA